VLPNKAAKLSGFCDFRANGLINGDTIAAIATPLGTGGISIVKVSGPQAIDAVAQIFRARDPRRQLQRLGSQRIAYGHICDRDQETPIDEVLVSVLRGPRSYTGEDVVEVNCHGGVMVTGAVMDLLQALGVRCAEPGEFTRRAFLNGRIDLTQAEATIDIIEAKTRRAALMGSRLLNCGLGEHIARLRDEVKLLRTRIEAAIDFCEEDDTAITPEAVRNTIRRNIIPDVQQLLDGYREGRLLRHGIQVVLAGKPNVGKSSLMNCLLRQNRVIVTEYPGTTRDIVAEGLDIGGFPVMLRDTAGLGRPGDPVERLGQQKTREAIEDADLVLLMIDASQSTDDADRDILASIGERPYLLVQNKIDLVKGEGDRPRVDLPSGIGCVAISALYGHGVEHLKEHIVRFAGMDDGAASYPLQPNQRQKALLSKARRVLNYTAEPTRIGDALELVAVDLKDCERYLGRILGIDIDPDVLDDIFNRFCIGK